MNNLFDENQSNSASTDLYPLPQVAAIVAMIANPTVQNLIVGSAVTVLGVVVTSCVSDNE